MTIKRIISGGQRGADVAGLRAAAKLGIETGGFMPKDFMTLDGPMPIYKELFGCVELQSKGYKPRTFANVGYADGTVRFARFFTTPGERCTRNAIVEFNKPSFDVVIMQVDPEYYGMVPTADEFADWLRETKIETLNVAGNAYSDIEYPVELYLVQALEVLGD